MSSVSMYQCSSAASPHNEGASRSHTSAIKVEEHDTTGISSDERITKDKLLHMLVFTILFLNILSLEHALFLIVERSPFVVGSFTVRPIINAADQRGWHPQDTIIARVDVYTRGVLCWEARNTLLREELRPHAVGCEALQVSNDFPATTTAPDSLSVPTVDQPNATCCRTVLFRVLMVAVAGYALYRMPSVLTAFDRLCGFRGFHRLTTFSAFCALLALAGNLKVLHNASQQAARLTFRHQDGNGLNYLAEIAPVSTAHPQLVPFGLSVVPIMFSTVVLLLSIFVAWRFSTRHSGGTHGDAITYSVEHNTPISAVQLHGPSGSKFMMMLMSSCVACTWIMLLPLLGLHHEQ